MDLIIDGYNLLALDRRLDRGLEQSRNTLINQLLRYHQTKGLPLTVVFDGWRSGSAKESRLTQEGIGIVYSRLGEKADAVVIRLARDRGSGAVVISSDNEIRRAVERFGAVAIHAHEFNQILQNLDSPGDELDADEWQEDRGARRNSGRLSKVDRKRMDKLRKLQL